MTLVEMQELLGMHCALCATMSEHLGSPHLAVAQHALLCIAQHQLSAQANSRLAALIMLRLDMGYTPRENATCSE